MYRENYGVTVHYLQRIPYTSANFDSQHIELATSISSGNIYLKCGGYLHKNKRVTSRLAKIHKKDHAHGADDDLRMVIKVLSFTYRRTSLRKCSKPVQSLCHQFSQQKAMLILPKGRDPSFAAR